MTPSFLASLAPRCVEQRKSENSEIRAVLRAHHRLTRTAMRDGEKTSSCICRQDDLGEWNRPFCFLFCCTGSLFAPQQVRPTLCQAGPALKSRNFDWPSSRLRSITYNIQTNSNVKQDNILAFIYRLQLDIKTYLFFTDER